MTGCGGAVPDDVCGITFVQGVPYRAFRILSSDRFYNSLKTLKTLKTLKMRRMVALFFSTWRVMARRLLRLFLSYSFLLKNSYCGE
jgi:hypothetical protein